ncbi:MAG: hypothetical protein U0457_13705 [Candidatus Sericytochromatia bacterium]
MIKSFALDYQLEKRKLLEKSIINIILNFFYEIKLERFYQIGNLNALFNNELYRFSIEKGLFYSKLTDDINFTNKDLLFCFETFSSFNLEKVNLSKLNYLITKKQLIDLEKVSFFPFKFEFGNFIFLSKDNSDFFKEKVELFQDLILYAFELKDNFIDKEFYKNNETNLLEKISIESNKTRREKDLFFLNKLASNSTEKDNLFLSYYKKLYSK